MRLKNKHQRISGQYTFNRVSFNCDGLDKIRLMHIINCYTFAGAEILAYNIAQRIDTDKFDVFICSIGKSDNEIESYIKNMLQSKNITVLQLDKPSHKNRVEGILKLAVLLRQYKINVINTHCSSPDFYGKLAGFLAGVPFVYSTIHSNVGYKRLREKFLRHFTAKYIAISESVKNYMLGDLGLPCNKIELISNGVKYVDFLDIDKVARMIMMDELGIDINKKVISSIGRLVKLKGHNFLIDAANAILEEYRDVHFLIVGNDKVDIEWANSLKRLVKDKSLERYFTFTGTRNDITDILSLTDVFVFPSINEGLPLAVLEAMAAGVPVVSTDVGSIGEVVSHGVNGLLIPSGNSLSIAQSIIKLFDNWEWAEKMGKNARKLVRSEYSIEDTAKRYEELYLKNFIRS